MTASEQAFDEWMNSPFIQPRSHVEEIVDAYMEYYDDHVNDPTWCAEQDAMYWEGRQGEPSTMEEFFEQMRGEDQYWYEEWVKEMGLTLPIKSSNLDQ